MHASRSLDLAAHLMIASILGALLIGLLAPNAAAKPVNSVPDISAISPDHGERGSTVTVTGRDFGGPKTKVSVGGVPAGVVSSTGARATFIVPLAAPLGPTTVRVTNPSGQFDTVAFTVASDDQIHPVLDTSRQSATVIGPDGGTVSASGVDGSRYHLQIPPGALDQEREITLTPVTSIANLPLSGGLRAAAHFEPSGLQLGIPGSLTITFTEIVPPVVAFAYGGHGDDFAVITSTIGTSTLVIPIRHFSGAGAGIPSAADFDALVAPFVGALGQLTYSQVRGLAELAIEWERMFGADFCETRASCAGAMQRAHDSLVALAEAACLTGHEDLGTTPALAAAVDAGRRLTDYEVTWDELRLVDEGLGAGSIAPESLPISVAGQVSAPGCRAAILGRVIARAVTLGESAPYATSDVGSTPGEDDVSNIGWLFALAASASELGLDDLVDQAVQAAELIIRRLLTGDPAAPGSGAVARAEGHPFEPAPAQGQEPIVIAGADIDGDAATSAWEWLLFLATEAQILGLDASDTATGALEPSLAGIIDRSAATCLSDETAGLADLERGRSYAVAVDLLVAEFDEALAACGIRIAISPTEASVSAGGQVQFSATVTGTTDTAVTWSSPDAADPVAGLFQAPLTPGTYHVVATITEHPSRTATAIVTVTGDVDVTVIPESPGVLALGATVQFSATVSGGATNAVTWTATGGNVTEDGLFTATTIGLASVTATSVDDSEISSTVIFEVDGTITVTVMPDGVTVAPGGTYQFSAVVYGTADQGVTWSASGGTIDADGLFTAGTAIGSGFYVLASSTAAAANGDFIYGRVYLSIYPPFEVVVDPNSYMHLQSFARARDWDGYHDGTGGCNGSAGIYGQVYDLGSATFACAASNGWGETAEAASSSSATVSSTSITLSGSASFALGYTADGDASGLHPARLEGFAESLVLIRFQVSAPIDYALTVTSQEPQNTCSWGMSDTNMQLVYAFSGVPQPATGTLYPGTVYILAGEARGWDGAQEATCAGSASFDASLTFSPPAG
jgi:hypothetical protein